ncbi:MAG TPA: ABC transporter permease [Acidimicrobiales bacterium]|nr:ABC transporter permease [Acidimicrobiales bacterium]
MIAAHPGARALSYHLARFRQGGKVSLLFMMLNPLATLAALGLGLGSLVDDRSAASLDGIDYVAFIAPGLLAATAMQTGAGWSLWPVLGGVKWDGTYNAQAATPLRPVDVLLGQLGINTVFVLIGVTMTFAAMLLFGAVESLWGVLALPAALLIAWAHAAPITAFSVGRESDAAFPLIFRLGIMPSYLFSGTFFPTSLLPDALERFAQLTPLWHGVELCRSLCLGTAELGESLLHVAWLSLFIAVGFWFARREFTKAIHP